MKLAVCLSGHLRKFEETFATLHNHLLSHFDCDIFIHTWDRMGYTSRYKGDSRSDDTSKYITAATNLYKPKKIVVESSSFVDELIRQGNDYAPHLRNEPKHVGHMASMFYKIYAANELRKLYERETNTNYDWVIRCRPDLIFHGNMQMPGEKVPSRVYIPKHLSGAGWYSDQFAVALPNDMDLYCSFFFNLDEYFRARNEFYPEKFMDWSFRKAGLTAMMWDCHFQILR